MIKNKSSQTSGEKFNLRDYISQIILLGIVGMTVAILYLIFPMFWNNYWIPVSVIATGLGIPPLFSLWKFWSGYGWQVGIAPGLTFVLLGIFIWFFGYDLNVFGTNAVHDLVQTNSIVLAIWLILILLAFWRRPDGELWRNYRWIIAPAVLILLFLFDNSWAQSTLFTSGLKKSIVETIPLDTHLQLYVEYPSQVLFDDTENAETQLWTTGSFDCKKKRTVEISSNKAFLFAVKPQPNTPVEWHNILEFELTEGASAVTLLAHPADNDAINSQPTRLTLKTDGKDLDTSAWHELNIENKRDSQIRIWKKNFLETSGIIVSLIVAVFAGLKQLEEEEKRKKEEEEKEEKHQRSVEIMQAINAFDVDIRNDFSSVLDKYVELVQDWGKWERPLQNQFSKKVTDFLDSNDFWEGLSDKDITKLTIIVGQFLKLKEPFQTAPKPEQLNLLSNSLQQDVRALLTMLRDYPQSIFVAKKIASTIPPALKNKISIEYKNDFATQIFDIKDELGFSDSESFPLRNQFNHCAKDHLSEDRLTMWLKAHQLDCSPFADAESPFYSVLDKKLLIDLATSGFTFPMPDFRNTTFRFANSWDAGTALFDYCKALQPNIKIKEETFFVTLTPSMVENYGTDLPQKIILHALAEQWIWSLAEAPTFFYSLKDTQRDLLGRLLRWHDLAPAITADKLAERLQDKREDKGTKGLPTKIKEWLSNADPTDLRLEEINALIGLRPSTKKLTSFLVSTIDLNPNVGKQIFPNLREKLDEKSEWLSAHDCAFIHFLIDVKKQQTVPQSSLENQCKIRMQKCSNNKVDAFDLLFAPHDEKPADVILANNANGSPGKMVRLGQRLLLQHMAKPSLEEYLQIKDLIALK